MDVGVVDSIYEPGDEFRNFNEVGKSHDPNEFEVESSSGHGFDVTRILSYFTANSRFHFFLAVPPEGNFRETHLIRAIDAAKQQGEIDVLNVSAGVDHIADPRKSCSKRGPQCLLSDTAREAVDSGVSVVASAGNKDTMEYIACPSLDNGVISVGGVLAGCGAKTGSSNSIYGPEIPGSMPVNAIWISTNDGPDYPPLCSTRGCFPGEVCSDNREIANWPGNVKVANNKPTTLAPCVTIVRNDENLPEFSFGTSYSAPFVSSQVANAISGLNEDGIEANPSEIRAAIGKSGEERVDFDVPVFYGFAFHKQLFAEHDITIQRTDDDIFGI